MTYMTYNKIFLLVRALYRSFLTWLPASLGTSCNAIQPVQQLPAYRLVSWLLETVAHKLVKLGLIAQLLLGSHICSTLNDK